METSTPDSPVSIISNLSADVIIAEFKKYFKLSTPMMCDIISEVEKRGFEVEEPEEVRRSITVQTPLPSYPPLDTPQQLSVIESHAEKHIRPKTCEVNIPKMVAAGSQFDDRFYNVERIVKDRIRRGAREYLIKLETYSASWNTWEPIENLGNILEMVDKFKALKATKRLKKRRR